MDPLELYARARDGGTWLELAVDGWRLVLGLAFLSVVTVLVLLLSTRETSFFGRLLGLLRAPSADHLFLRVSLLGPFAKDGSNRELQAYLAAVASHQILLYTKFPCDPGLVAFIDPPGVRMVVTGIREVSANPPWFAIEAEPLFRDDGAKVKFRKFIGEISHAA